MIDVATRLRIKYGLIADPDDRAIAAWSTEVQALLAAGLEAEAAGHRAAQKVFPDYNRMSYKAQSDTILALLAAVKEKGTRRG